MDPELLTIEVAARYLSVSRATAYAWARAGLVPTVRVNGLLRVPRSALERWIADQHADPRSVSDPTATDLTRRNP